ncbi:uncharacterized protein CEXT_542291 [Caerostris extrusa]|uniref:C2H2-type domain-containing protein n=1 Tax=Caerostris extrusa TaxID=172846 RepID=A0AAV4T0A2_CAEEX|nr:uncharacterized protein CEXT_542291 [Caerostris extrusa]
MANKLESNKLQMKECSVVLNRIDYSISSCSEDDISSYSEDDISSYSEDDISSYSEDDISSCSEDEIKAKDLSCKSCKETFKTHASLLIHQRKHKRNAFKCVLCSAAFKLRQHFYSHMERHHPEVETYVCDFPKCEKSFSRQKQLKDHLKSHWKYMCKFCKKGYISKKYMKWHVKKIH